MLGRPEFDTVPCFIHVIPYTSLFLSWPPPFLLSPSCNRVLLLLTLVGRIKSKEAEGGGMEQGAS